MLHSVHLWIELCGQFLNSRWWLIFDALEYLLLCILYYSEAIHQRHCLEFILKPQSDVSIAMFMLQNKLYSRLQA